jgi:predicted PurR-regulated permease PerM
VALILYFLFIVRDVIVMTFAAIIISAALHGPVAWLEKKKVPRVLATFFVYLLALSIFALVIYLVLPLLIDEANNLSKDFPKYLQQMENIGLGLETWLNKYQIRAQLEDVILKTSQWLAQYSLSIVGLVIALFGGLVSAIVILVISFYMTLSAKDVKNYLVLWVPRKNKEYASDLINRVQQKLSYWLAGQFVLSLIVGSVILVGLYFLNVKYLLILAFMAAVFESVPWFGPIASTIMAVIIAFFQSPTLALAVLILYFLVQQLENHLIVPLVMKKAVGLSPVAVIIAILAGAKLAGILGILLAVPIAAIVVEVGRDIQKRNE